MPDSLISFRSSRVAIEFTGTPESCTDVSEFLGHDPEHQWKLRTTDGLTLYANAQFPINVSPGNWIVRHPDGSLTTWSGSNQRA